MYVACSTLCFGKRPLPEALRTIGELGFSKVDVAIQEKGPHLRPSEVAADTAKAVHKLRAGPGLGLSFDPSHYLTGPYRGQNLDPLYPYVRHVRLRDSGTNPDQFQVRIGQGSVEYGRIVTQLARHHYHRLLSVDIHDQPEPPYALQPEVRKLKFLLESLI